LLVIGIVVYLTIGICGLFYYLIKLVVLKHSERKKIETEKGGEHMRKINWGAVIIIIAFILIIAGLGYITFTNFEFLNTHNGAINLLFAGIVAISTLIYAILTWRLVDETKEMRKAQTDPSISVTIEPREEWISFIDMRIMNIGAGPAYNIKFKIEPDFENFKGNFLSQMKLMQGINYLAQSQKIQFFLTTLTENFAEKIKTPFTIKVTYENKIGATFTENFVIDFSQFEGMAQLGEPPLHKIAKNIENIERDIGHLSTGFHKLQTVVYTKKDIEAEHSERMKQVKKKLKNNRK